MSKLQHDFYLNKDVVEVARNLLGKYLLTNIDGTITGGEIVETEAYAGVTDRASHAFGNRLTPRTRIMYKTGGTAYIYLCYGIHSLFNVVTNDEGIPHAVLVRAIKPEIGIGRMIERLNAPEVNSKSLHALANGPGKVSRALGISYTESGLSLLGDRIWIEDRGKQYPTGSVFATKRIGVEYAGDDAALPYRFLINIKI